LLIARLSAALGGVWQFYNCGLGSQSVGSYLATIGVRLANALDTGTTPGAAVAAPGTTMPAASDIPAAVLINLGVNDSLLTLLSPFPTFPAGSTDAAGWQANYLAIIDYIRSRWANAPIYIMRWWAGTAPAGHDNTEAGWIDTLITLRPNCFLGPDERVFLKGSDNGATNTYDQIHPGSAGHIATVTAWEAVLVP
jgi:lysophospholipase L1-like esterase